MSSSTRVVIVLAVLLLVFAAVLIGARFRDDSKASSSDKHWWTDGLNSVFGEKEPLRSPDVMGDCFQGGTYRILLGRSCTVRLRSSDVTLRSFRLQLAAGLKVTAELQPGGKHAVPIKVPLKADSPETPNLQVPKDGANLTLSCDQSSAPQCVILLASPK